MTDKETAGKIADVCFKEFESHIQRRLIPLYKQREEINSKIAALQELQSSSFINDSGLQHKVGVILKGDK